MRAVESDVAASVRASPSAPFHSLPDVDDAMAVEEELLVSVEV